MGAACKRRYGSPLFFLFGGGGREVGDDAAEEILGIDVEKVGHEQELAEVEQIGLGDLTREGLIIHAHVFGDKGFWDDLEDFFEAGNTAILDHAFDGIVAPVFIHEVVLYNMQV